MLELKLVKINKPADVNIILGQSHFIKTVEDIYELLVNNVPGIKFGIAFVESSGACKIRCEGNDSELTHLVSENMMAIGAGHSFLVFIKNAYPINVLNGIKNIPEVCNIYCASANPAEVIIARSDMGCGILGVIDGSYLKGLENEEDKKWRHDFLRNIGYKL